MSLYVFVFLKLRVCFFFFSCRLRVALRVLGEKIRADHGDGKSTRCFSDCFTVQKTAKAPILIKLRFYYGRKVKKMSREETCSGMSAGRIDTAEGDSSAGTT